MVELKYRWDPEKVLFRSESASTTKEAVIEAARQKAYLRGAYLRGAYLRGADLRGAYLRGADLCGADLRGAYLRGADLCGADLCGADLCGADLGGAYLRGAYLRRADLGRADLGGADLGGAYLRWADLRGAHLCGAYLCGAKINWQSHDVVAEILIREADDDIEKRKIAGLILVSRDWCWDRFLAIESGLREWALDTLSGYVTDGDGAPKILAERKSAKATPETAKATA